MRLTDCVIDHSMAYDAQDRVLLSNSPPKFGPKRSANKVSKNPSLTLPNSPSTITTGQQLCEGLLAQLSFDRILAGLAPAA